MQNINNLSSTEFEEIFNQIIDNKINESEVEKFLLDLNENNLPTNAFIGAVNALKKRMTEIKAPNGAIDVCGTGGDKLNTLNISTAVCFVVAGAGIPVAKHGNKAISSKSGSADIFSELGISHKSDIAEIEKTIKEKNLCFLFAPFFHGALKNVAEVRKSLGVPTIFNFLGPLLNPANTKFQLIGVSRKDVMKKMAAVVSDFHLSLINQNEQPTTINQQLSTYIVHGFDGMDEITLTDNSYLLKVENGKILEEKIINPKNYGFNKVNLEDLKGADPKYNSQKLLALLDGEKSAYRDIVILNSAFALKLSRKVNSVEEGVDLASSILDEGKAKTVLDQIKNSK